MKKLGFGTMRLPLLNAEDPTSVDLEQFKQMVDLFMAKGFTYYDTAYVYHNKTSESFLKQALVDRYPRDSYTITTKLHSSTFKSLEDRDKVFNEQLQKTGVGYFDYYWLHCLMAGNVESVFEKFDCFNWLIEKKKQGFVKHIGFSFHDNVELLDDILTKHPEMEYVQLQINYLDWESYDIQSRKCYEVCMKHNKQVIIMEPVKGGALADVSPAVEKLFKDYDANMSIASWGVRFAATLDNVYMVLSGMSNLAQMQDNISYMENFKPLSKDEFAMCLKAADIINSERAIKCTGCSYCTAGCPEKIDIPELFRMYNRLHQTTSGGTLGRMHAHYNEYIKTNPGPANCIECGQCESACPQHLSIRAYLKDVTKDFE